MRGPWIICVFSTDYLIFKSTASKISIFALKLIHFESIFRLWHVHVFWIGSTNEKYILAKKIFLLLFAFQTIHLIHISLEIAYLCPNYCSLAPSEIKRVKIRAANHNIIIDMTWMILPVHQSQSSTISVQFPFRFRKFSYPGPFFTKILIFWNHGKDWFACNHWRATSTKIIRWE